MSSCKECKAWRESHEKLVDTCLCYEACLQVTTDLLLRLLQRSDAFALLALEALEKVNQIKESWGIKA